MITLNRIQALLYTALHVLITSMLAFFPTIANARELTTYSGLSADELEADVWQLCGREQFEGRSAQLPASASGYCEALPDRCDYFVFANDSVLWTGYSIGRRIGVLADAPCYVYDRKQLAADASADVNCAGRMDVSTAIEEHGNVAVSVIGRGRAVIAPGDTVNNAVLVRQTSRFAPLDTIAAEEHERITYRWYASGDAVPFAIQVGGELYVDASFDICDSVDADDDADRIKDAIDAATIAVDGDMVTISLGRDLHVTAYIMDATGNIYNSTAGLGHEFTLSTSGLTPRQYLIAISAEGADQYMRKIVFTKI